MSLPLVLLAGPALLCAVSWLGVGRLVPRRLLTGEPLCDGLTRVALGSAVVSLLVLGLGSVGLARPPLLVALTVAAALAGVPALASLRAVPGRLRVAPRTVQGLVGLAVVAVLLDLVAATAPVTSADALKYHLALPRLWLETGTVASAFWQWESFNPSAVEALYTQGLALGGGSAAAALHALLAALAGLAVYGLARELAGTALAGAAAEALFLLQGIVTWEATSSFVELGTTFYLVLAAWHGVRWGRIGGSPAAIATGALAGAAAGTKYLGLVAAAIVIGLVAVVALRRRRLPDLALAGAATAATGGAWYVRNLVETGNPLYPFLFGGRWLGAFAREQVRASLDPYGVPHGLLRLPILPIDLALHSGAFDQGRYVGFAVLLLAPLAPFVARAGATSVLAIGVGLALVAWELESPQARFLLPALGVAAALAGAVVAAWLADGGVRRSLAVAALSGAGALWLVASVALTRQLLPSALGLESRAAALQRLTGTYDALLAARRRVGPGTIALAGYPFPFNVPGRAISLGAPEFTPELDRATAVGRLRALGVRAVLAGGDPAAIPELAPLRSCLVPEKTYAARFVTSRSLATSIPYELTLYGVDRCTGRA